jgi:hypothetical protein
VNVSTRELARATVRLPYALRDQILGFATYVEDVADDLLAEMGYADVPPTRIQEFVYVAGLWRLWELITSQISILENALALLSHTSARGVQLGQSIYSVGTRQADFAFLERLRDDLRDTLIRQGLFFVTTSRSLQGLARNVMESNGS